MRSIATRIALALATFALLGCERYELDKRMLDLCKKDGGVKVFHQVTLPSKDFSTDGIPLSRYWLDSTLIGTTARLGPDYGYVVSESILKAGDPMKGQGRLVRRIERIYRATDQTLLGESVWYGRAGGDFLVLEHFSTAGCPSPVESLLTAVFVMSSAVGASNAGGYRIAGMSQVKAARFDQTWLVPSESPGSPSGFSASLLLSRSTEEKALAIRGTEPSHWDIDYVADFIGIFGDQLRTMPKYVTL